jgi:hypothetical protein
MGRGRAHQILRSARVNQWATFWKKRSATKKLIAIDAQFVKVSKDWLNPESPIAASLLIRVPFCLFSAWTYTVPIAERLWASKLGD